jgi:two-component system phosphate regulon response regulator PhoB
MEICQRLKQDPQTSQVPVIIVTAKGSETDMHSGMCAGATDYIVKPFHVKDLVGRVEAALKRTRPEGRRAALKTAVWDDLENGWARVQARLADLKERLGGAAP